MKKQTILLMLAGIAVVLWCVITITLILNKQEVAKQQQPKPIQQPAQQDTIFDDCDCIAFFTACGYSPARCEFMRDSIHLRKLSNK